MLEQSQPLGDAVLDALFASDLPVGLAVLDRGFRYVRVNEALLAFNGLSREQLIGRTVEQALPEAFAKLAPLLNAVLNDGVALKNFLIQAEVPSHPGTLSEWEASYLPLFDANQAVTGILVQAINITSQQKAARVLRESEARVRHVLDSLFVFVGVLSTDGILREANQAPLQAAGITLEQVRGRPFWEAFWWSHDPELQAWLREAVREAAAGRLTRRDVQVRMRDDSRMTIDFMLAPMRDEAGTITHLIPSAIDVSDRVHGERALRASEARFRSAFDAAPDGMALVGQSGTILLANRAMESLFACSAQDLQGGDINQLVPLPSRGVHAAHVNHFFAHLQTRDMAKRRRLQALRKDGTTFHVEVGLNPIPGSDPPEVLATVIDIDERLAAQAQVERSLKEKTALLSEVHHRVKNNLQIISSLLHLQSRNVDDSVKAVLRDSKSRIRAMALTHQLLYERNDFSSLELGPYLKQLASLLHDAYIEASQQIEIRVQAPDAGMNITLQAAIPCGLIVNELVTNALKHAFPGRQRGLVEISARVSEDGGLQVDVRDDGIGLPGQPDWTDSRTLGFQLIPLLAEQLDGRLIWLKGAGTHVRISFNTNREVV